MKTLFLLLSLYAPFALIAQPLTAEQSAQFKAQLIAKTRTLQTMQADFQQKKHLDFMSRDIEIFGKMAFAKPSQLNWQYTKPYQYRIIFQKDNITVNDAGKVFKKINHLIISSVTGDMFDEKEFTISLSQSGKHTLVKLLPKDKNLLKYIREINLYFDAQYLVDRVKLIEPTADYTEIIFTNKKLNTSIDEANFKI